MNLFIAFILLCLCVTYPHQFVMGSYFGARSRFESKFTQICAKYPFVAQYIDSIQNPRTDYVLYVFHEQGLGGGNGGLGDRLGGMITALAFALRTNRQFLILGDKPFTDAFQPYQGNSNHTSTRTWASWEWAGWKTDYASNMTYNKHCVNPKPRGVACALDKDSPQFKVIKFRGNRAYLCRWAVKPSLGLQESLKATLGINDGTDLYEVAGCLLRLAMWPTEKLWTVLDSSFRGQLLASSGAGSGVVSHQIGFHFRCGDSSFTSSNNNKNINKECVYDPAVQWNGTSFYDDLSRDSPMDLAQCGKQVLGVVSRALEITKQSTTSSSTNNHPDHILAYIASDYPPSARQINETLGWPLTIVPREACHVDLMKSNANGNKSKSPKLLAEDCSLSTTSQWLMLSLSDTIIMQSLHSNPGMVSPYKPRSPETARLVTIEEQGPISAFSRYAAIYSLSPDVMRYGLNCTAVNKKNLSRQTMGNWICDPKMFH